MNTIEQIDVFIFKYPHHYKIGGHEETPGRLPGTDYYIEPQWKQAYSRATESCLVKITLSDGCFGWGEAQAPITPETTATLITTLLGPSLIGQDRNKIQELNERMYNLMLVRGHSGSFLVDAIAGLDTALWDIRGKRENASISELLGGAGKKKLSAYISGLRKKTLDEKVTAAKEFMQRGFAGVKIFIGADMVAAEEEARAIREALPKEAFFAIDALWSLDLASAEKAARLLEELNGSWLEAPMEPEDVQSHSELVQKTRTPIAIGETLRTVRAFEPWFRQNALRVAQPDVMRSGISETMKIAALAKSYGVPVAPHVGVSTGIGIAATWQVAAALDSNLPQEHQCDLFDTANQILLTPLVEASGQLQVPERPGLGVDVDEEKVKKYSPEQWRVDKDGRRMTGGK